MERPREARRASGEDEDEEPAPPPALVESAPRLAIRSEATCPLCLEGLTSQPRLDVCPDCKTIQHTTCVAEFGRCATLGCRGIGVGLGGQSTNERTPPPGYQRRDTPPPGYAAARARDPLEQLWYALGLTAGSPIPPVPTPPRTQEPPATGSLLDALRPRASRMRALERALVVLAFIGALAVPALLLLGLLLDP